MRHSPKYKYKINWCITFMKNSKTHEFGTFWLGIKCSVQDRDEALAEVPQIWLFLRPASRREQPGIGAVFVRSVLMPWCRRLKFWSSIQWSEVFIWNPSESWLNIIYKYYFRRPTLRIRHTVRGTNSALLFLQNICLLDSDHNWLHMELIL